MSKSYSTQLRDLLMPDSTDRYPLCDESEEWNDVVHSLANFYEIVKENWLGCKTIKRNIPLILQLLKEMEPEVEEIYNSRVIEFNKEIDEDEKECDKFFASGRKWCT